MRVLLIFVLLFCHLETLSAEELWTTYTADSGLNNNNIEAIAVDHNNAIWVAQKEAVSIFDGEVWKELPELDGWHIRTIVVDSNNTTWIGAEGLFSYKNEVLTFIQSSPFYYLKDILVDENNVLWISDMGDFESPPRILTFNGTQFTKVLDEYLHYITIWELARDSNNDIWMAGGGILYQYSWVDNHVYEYLPPESEEVRTIITHIAIDQNDVCWTSIVHPDTGVSYLGSYKDGLWEIYNTDNSDIPENNAGLIAVDRNNVKWIGTGEGLVRFDGEDWEIFTTENSGIVSNSIWALAVDHDNAIWIGTREGLSCYTGDIITAIDEEPKPEPLPTLTSYPNPFNPSTTISFTLPEGGHANLVIYNLAGQKVRTLADEPMDVGNHIVVWDGHDDAGQIVAAGVYVTRLAAGDVVATGKMVLVK